MQRQAVRDLAGHVHRLPAELKLDIWAYCVPYAPDHLPLEEGDEEEDEDMSGDPTTTVRVSYDNFPFTLLPRLFSKAVCESYEKEVIKHIQAHLYKAPFTITTAMPVDDLWATNSLIPQDDRDASEPVVVDPSRPTSRYIIWSAKSFPGFLLMAAMEMCKLKRESEFTRFGFDVEQATKLLRYCGQVLELGCFQGDITNHNTDKLGHPIRIFLFNAMVALLIRRKVVVRLTVPAFSEVVKGTLVGLVHDLRFLADNYILEVEVCVTMGPSTDFRDKMKYTDYFCTWMSKDSRVKWKIF
ncbi:unnamed protein product [Alternaria alternata]